MFFSLIHFKLREYYICNSIAAVNNRSLDCALLHKNTYLITPWQMYSQEKHNNAYPH